MNAYRPSLRYLQRSLPGALAALLLLAGMPAARASLTGHIIGVVTDSQSGQPLADVTVTATSPSTPGPYTTLTDRTGHYRLMGLPPGQYLVHFERGEGMVERPNVFVDVDKTIALHVLLDPAQAAPVPSRAPASVDATGTQLQTHVPLDFARNTPFGRNFPAVIQLTPSAGFDAVGPTFGGATGAENVYLIDGLNTTNPSFGLIGTTLSLEFIRETHVVLAGLGVDYGRTLGSAVNVVTKSGSNEFHGGAWVFYTPLQLTGPLQGRLTDPIVSRSRHRYAVDLGFDLGGPIVKDRIWFYAGFHPQLSSTTTDRIIRTRLAENVDNSAGTGAYPGDLVTLPCPAWLAPGLCTSVTTFATRALPNRTSSYRNDLRNYQYIGKLDFRLHPQHTLSLEYIGTATNVSGALGAIVGAEEQILRQRSTQTHDAQIHLVSHFLGRQLRLDVLGGYHGEQLGLQRLTRSDAPPTAVQVTNTRALASFEDLPECAVVVVGANNRVFNPCPITNYRYGGIGPNQESAGHRAQVSLALSYLLRLGGVHGLRLGFDFMDDIYRRRSFFTGVGIIEDRGTTIRRTQYATLDPDSGAVTLAPTGYRATTNSFYEALSLRDIWEVGYVPGLVIHAGLRWEPEQVRDAGRETRLNILGNVAPRVGAVYDFTRRGRGNVYAAYGRLYETLPLNLNDRALSSESLVGQSIPRSACTNAPVTGRIDPFSCSFPQPTPAQLMGGGSIPLSPAVRGQFTSEFVGGIRYDLGLDLVVGAAYVYRTLERVVEDAGLADGSRVLGNPGAKTDPRVVQRLENEISDLDRQLATTNDPATRAELLQRRAERSQQLTAYSQLATLPRPRREYHALVLTVTKHFSRNFSVLASYTYSRTLGNYPGLYQSSNGQLDPNVSTQYDNAALEVNRNGPLPTDRPHNLKITGYYTVPLRSSRLTFGLNFNALSGTPIEVLGRHPQGGARDSFLLPRGSGGRTPFLTTFDLHLAYGHLLPRGLRIEATCDLFNLFNQRRPTAVDQEYTVDAAAPIQNGRPADLASLVDANTGLPVRVNPNYGQPIAYQTPLSLRLGLRVAF